MHVACSTQCFSHMPLEDVLKLVAEMEFSKLDLVITESSNHLRPSEVANDVKSAIAKLRSQNNVTPAAITLDIDVEDQAEYDRQFKAVCQLARMTRVPLITITASPTGTGIDDEVKRLRHLAKFCDKDGITLSLATRQGTLTESPATAVELCEKVPGLALTLDPSHYIATQTPVRDYDQVYPYVRHVHLRDSGRGPNQFQVLVGQGEIEFSRVITQLERCHYNRLLTIDIQDCFEPTARRDPEVRKLKFLLESLV